MSCFLDFPVSLPYFLRLKFAANFAINTNTGVVTVLGDLDTENRSQYQIRVQARENLGVPVTVPDVVRHRAECGAKLVLLMGGCK